MLANNWKIKIIEFIKNALFKNVKFDPSSHLKKNQVGLVSQKQITVQN
jgi:hypothetical protein